MSSSDMQLAQDAKDFLWANFDPNDDLLYPTFEDWDDLLTKTIEADNYEALTKEQVLSVLFGLIHRNRICEGLWWSFYERGITQKLLSRLNTVGVNELG